ncbi:MAG: hypothetical protein AB1847_18720 [bacterium]
MAHIFFERLEKRHSTQVLTGITGGLFPDIGTWFPWTQGPGAAGYTTAPYFGFSPGPRSPWVNPLARWSDPFPPPWGAFSGFLGQIPYLRNSQAAVLGATLGAALAPTVTAPIATTTLSPATSVILSTPLPLITLLYGLTFPSFISPPSVLIP